MRAPLAEGASLPDYAKRVVVQAELVADDDPSGSFGLPDA
jgi:hypothetical protein